MSNLLMHSRRAIACQLAAFSLIVGVCLVVPSRALAADDTDATAEPLVLLEADDEETDGQAVLGESETIAATDDAEETQGVAISDETDGVEASLELVDETADPVADAPEDEDAVDAGTPLSQDEEVIDDPIAAPDDDEPAQDDLVPMAVADGEDGDGCYGWTLIDDQYHYFDEDGSPHTGWLDDDDNGGRYYFDENGVVCTGWKTISGKRFYFDKESYAALTGLQTISGKKYYFYSGGAAATGWKKISGKKYYFDAKTYAAYTGWKTISGKKYYFDSAGRMRTGIVKISGKRYAFASSGVLLSAGIRTVGGKRYYVNRNGSLGYGLKTVKGKKYLFLSSSGVMAKSRLYKNYIIAWNGVCHAIPAASGSQDASAQRVAALIAKCITPASKIKSKKDLMRAREAAAYVAAFADRGTYTMQGKLYRTPYGVFYGKQYSCAGTTRALGAVFNKLGFSWKHLNENQYTHQWCKVKLDGKWGWADSCIERQEIDWDTGKVKKSVVTGQAGYGKHFANM